jgi:stage II sporulation protein R
MKKNIIIVTILLSIFIILTTFSYSKAVCKDLSDSVLRLHVIANSNSVEDQNLKYKVRDALLTYMNSLVSNSTSKKEVLEIASEHLSNFKDIATNVIKENGYNYDVNVELGNFEFPTKQYGDISFPAGYYDALKVEIGSHQGRNWWCVMFPPLCFVDVTSGVVPEDSKENLKDNLSDEDYSIISKDSITSEFKFKIVELFKDFSNNFSNN